MRKLFTLLFVAISLCLVAQSPAGYYNAAIGKTEAALKTQLYSIISTGTTDVGYAGLYNIYPTSDLTATGKVWDMYSTCTWTHGVAKCGNYSAVCDCYNREHSIPQSWFSEQSPMVSDAHHIYPTDGKVNGQRSNYPHGECAVGVTLAGGKGRLGSSTYAGYTGTVFEPDDEFKGDFARTYFYFATRYQNIMVSFIGGPTFDHTTYPSLAAWSIDLYLKWSRQDPVSTKETTRNNAIDVFQHNRNPFIDHPELAEYIWGSHKGEPWSLSSAVDEVKIAFSISPNPVQ
ncbi:MAG TPA: endonuclease, partial [Paludibacter sp.]